MNFRSPNFKIIPKAASDKEAKIVLYKFPESPGDSSIMYRTKDFIEVNADTIDNMCAEINIKE